MKNFANSQPKADSDLGTPINDAEWIWKLFKGRCIVCRKAAQDLNELIPRSRSQKSLLDWKNRVPMCRECHVKYHASGVSLQKLVALKEKRAEYLRSIGREKYI
jgi:5-methylcytosine-specific restriction endonuclease McrA